MLFFGIISISLIVTGFTACRDPERQRISRSVSVLLEKYPAATLQDIYKSFFQDEFGPGHLLEDTAAARKYLADELAKMTSRGNYTAEPCGAGLNFYRVPLDLVKDEKISFNEYLTAFLESGSSFRIPATGEWKAKWGMIVLEIESMNLEIKNFESDKKNLSKMLDEGETTVHHSESYSLAYDPHYRIMSRVQCERLVGSVR
ncbi:MAG: hypothetical protein KBC43_01850 [Bacteroidales bacterium]|nr:hypothetical protein [Bacteroidales bacterium]